MNGLTPERKPASPHTERVRVVVGDATPDMERATRGLLAPAAPRRITGRFAHAVWDLDDYAFLDEPDAPATVHPGLWRQARLNGVAGLFEVAPSIYQVRGMDISNITFLEGETGWIVIDPLTGTETARAALDMVHQHFGVRPVHAVVYTHSHTDHFGGVHGVVSSEDVASGRVMVIAPQGFLEAAISENVLAGTAMLRRATYMYGALLEKDARGHVDTGLGKGLPAAPSVGLIAPTREIGHTGEEMTIDGVRLVFQITPGTEAPAEMNVHLPEWRALCMAENCTATQHNVYTLRGAQVRDALAWSKYIDESLERFAPSCDVLFASHHWPRWGSAEIAQYLASQRDAYRYVHDQTLRLANHGLTMNEIAEQLELPRGLGDEYFNRGYYGTVSHNAKAVYQRYLGWFDANPAHLNPHPPVEAARRYVDYMGGAAAVLDRARESFEQGDYRWVCEVVNHVVFAEPDNVAARLLQADALEQLGYQSESGPWRDFYLSGALELRANGTVLKGLGANSLAPGLVASMTVELLLDLLGVRLNGPRAEHFVLEANLTITNRANEKWLLEVRHGVVHPRRGDHFVEPGTEVDITLEALAQLVSGAAALDTFIEAGTCRVVRGRAALDELLGLLDQFDLGFEIVLP